MAKPARMEGGISGGTTTDSPNRWERTTTPSLVGGSGAAPGDG